MTTLMKAVRFHDYGGPDVMKLEEIPRPACRDDQVLVRVHAVSVNPVDWKIREGMVRKRVNIPLPATPGGDLSGVIEQAGSRVEGWAAGQPVFALIGLMGAYAEYVAIDPSFVAPKPASIDHVGAASVPLVGLTAHQALFEHGDLKAGQRVLVHAAAGGVGGFAVQLARNAGAEVVGTASAANVDYVRGLGASDVIDYRSPHYDRYRASVDLVFDLIGGEATTQSLAALKKGGVLVSAVPAGDALREQAAAAGVRVAGFQVHPDGRQLREIGALIDAGKVRTTIAAVYPIASVGQAHDQSKTGHTRGKIVLTFAS